MAKTPSQLRQRKTPAADNDNAKPPAEEQKEEEEKVEDNEEDEIIIKNGKAYKKRKDLPDVGYLMTYGMPGREGMSTRDPSKPWYTDFYLPGILLVVFVISLVAFHHVPFKPRVKPRFSLDEIRARTAEQQRMQHVQEERKRRLEQVEFVDPGK